MKNLILLLALLVVSGNVFAGIPTTQCSTHDAGVRQVSDYPGSESLVVKLDGKGKEAKITMRDLTVKQSNIHVIREHQAQMSYSKIYSATLSISRDNGEKMPDAYTANRNEDGSLTVDVICEFSVF